MVVVPALAKREQPDPPVVARQVARVPRLRTPQVGGRVYEPRDVEDPHLRRPAGRPAAEEEAAATEGKSG
eukprot:353498-Chlamydomonas_euryale.AAC.1